MLSKLYNSAKKGASKVTGKLSDFFSSTTTYERPPDPVQQAPIAPTASGRHELPSRGASFTEEDFEMMKPLVYGEVSNRGLEKRQMEADVIFNTAINRQKEYENHPYSQYKGSKLPISEIVAMPNQYQAYGGDQYQNYYNPQNPVDVAKKKEVDMIVDMIADKIRRGEYVDNTEGAFYYIHEDDGKIKYDNLRKLYK